MANKLYPVLLLLTIIPSACAQVPSSAVELNQIADGFTAPISLTAPEDGTGRIFVADQIGLIRVLEANGSLLEEPLLDIRDKIASLDSNYDERGLLMEVDEPQPNNNGGRIVFGPDGYLYIPTGDGGRADDIGIGHTPVIGNAQDLTKPLGKVLRIDVNNASNGMPYGIPSDNPFTGNRSVKPEIYAYGFRNPAFTSFDSQSGLMFIGNAGQNLFESAYIIVKGGDYGWNIREGTHCFDPLRRSK